MWNFSCPLIVYGDNALDYLAQVKGKKAFIVTDKNIVKLGLDKTGYRSTGRSKHRMANI